MPPRGARGRSGVLLTFLFDSHISFSFGRRVCLPSPFWCEPEPLVSARLQEEPLASAWSERAVRSSPSFLYAPCT